MLSMSLRTVAPAVLITLLCAFACAQSDKASFKDLVAQAPDLIRLQDEFEQTVPPGVSIEAREVYRKGTSGKDLEVRYNVIVKGVPLGTTLRQVQFPVNTDKAVPGINGITLNSDGLMICASRTPSPCHSGDKLDAPVVFVQQNLLKGAKTIRFSRPRPPNPDFHRPRPRPIGRRGMQTQCHSPLRKVRVIQDRGFRLLAK